MPRVLVLDSDRDLRELLVLVTGRLGYEHAESTERPDVVIVEPAAPSALTQARELHERWPTVPIVCASAWPPIDEARALDPVAYLIRPFSSADLGAVLERTLGGPGH